MKAIVIQGVFPKPYPRELMKPAVAVRSPMQSATASTPMPCFLPLKLRRMARWHHAGISKTKLGKPKLVADADVVKLRQILPATCLPPEPCDRDIFQTGEFAGKGIHLWEKP